MSLINKLDKFHQTRRGNLVFGAVELIATYGLASIAIDSGSLLIYFAAVIFLIGGIHNIFKAIFYSKPESKKAKGAKPKR